MSQPDERKYLSPAEVQLRANEAAKLAAAETAAIVNERLDKQDASLDRIERLAEDGNQISKNTHFLLQGNLDYGIKGALPELQERLGVLEERVEKIDRTSDTRHEDNSKRFDKLEKGQRKILSRQGRFRRRFELMCKWLTEKGEDGKRGWRRLWPFIVFALGWILTKASEHWPSWNALKVFATKFATLVGKLPH